MHSSHHLHHHSNTHPSPQHHQQHHSSGRGSLSSVDDRVETMPPRMAPPPHQGSIISTTTLSSQHNVAATKRSNKDHATKRSSQKSGRNVSIDNTMPTLLFKRIGIYYQCSPIKLGCCRNIRISGNEVIKIRIHLAIH